MRTTSQGPNPLPQVWQAEWVEEDDAAEEEEAVH